MAELTTEKFQESRESFAKIVKEGFDQKLDMELTALQYTHDLLAARVVRLEEKSA